MAATWGALPKIAENTPAVRAPLVVLTTILAGALAYAAFQRLLVRAPPSGSVEGGRPGAGDLAGDTEEHGMSDVRTLVRAMTLIIAELVFVALIGDFVIETWEADANTPPDLSGVQVSAAAALAVALGAGYAALLGVPAQDARFTIQSWKTLLTEKTFVVVGVIAYMVAGFAACITYGLHEEEGGVPGSGETARA
jgi:hypothetical protein